MGPEKRKKEKKGRGGGLEDNESVFFSQDFKWIYGHKLG